MGRHYHYKPGSFYRQDDRTGFPQRAERTKIQWNGLIVDDSVWEPRQPQDFVRGVPDLQGVPLARPLPSPTFVGPVYVATTAAAVPQATTLTLATVRGFRDGSEISVMMDNGIDFQTTVDGNPPALTITLADPLPYFVASGNMVTLWRENPGVDG